MKQAGLDYSTGEYQGAKASRNCSWSGEVTSALRYHELNEGVVDVVDVMRRMALRVFNAECLDWQRAGIIPESKLPGK